MAARSERRPALASVVASCALAVSCGAGSVEESQPRSTTTEPPQSAESNSCPTAPVTFDAPVADETPFAWPDYPRCAPENLKWVEESEELQVEDTVRCTLSELARFDPEHAPARVDDGSLGRQVWLVRYAMTLRKGAILELHGAAFGGDVDELRLRSDPGPPLADFEQAAPGVFATLRADWGGLDLAGVHVLSWDAALNGPDQDRSDGRAYLAVRSVYKDGAALESRMDVRNSEISYLGYHASESYGLAWRIPDGDATTDTTLFDTLNVYGDILDSHLHHNFFGAYTFGAYGMRVQRNEFEQNEEYGFDPHDDSDSLIVEDNWFHDNGKHGFICSKRCDHLQLRRNTSNDNVANGFMLHSQCTDWLIEGNEATGNGGGGIVLFESSGNVIRGNRLWNNKNGIVLLSGSSDNLVLGNEIGGSTSYGIYAYLKDPPLEGDGHPRRNQIVGNVVSSGQSRPLKLSNADENLIEQNRFSDHDSDAVVVSGASGNRFHDNCIPSGLAVKSSGTADAPSLTIAEQAFVDASLDPASGLSARDAGGALFDAHDGQPTVVTPAGSSLDVVPGPSGSRVAIARLPVSVLPDSGSAVASLDQWSPSAVTISITPDVGAESFRVTVAGLPPGAAYEASVDGAVVASDLVDSDGVAAFDVTRDETRPFSVSLKTTASR